ncbi:MAG: hypothetical protein V3U02_13195 [Calditrichia bacterium]
MNQAEIDEIIEYLQETEGTLDRRDLDEEDKDPLLAELGDIIERLEAAIADSQNADMKYEINDLLTNARDYCDRIELN